LFHQQASPYSLAKKGTPTEDATASSSPEAASGRLAGRECEASAFISPSKGKMTLEAMVVDILDYISEDLEQAYKLIVGSDSQPRETGVCYVSAVIIHRLGKGARYYFNRQYETRKSSMRQRIFYEASLSLTLADEISKALKKHGREDMAVEIHLDVGTHGLTKELIKDVIGMVVGSGFDAKIKPDASGASKVADRYTK